jgi:tankyrase
MRMDDSLKNDLVAALDDAVSRAELEEVRYLLDLGADPNAVDALGWTPVMNAAWVASVPVIKLLLAYGADPSLVNSEGKTAIDLARDVGHNEYGHDEVVEFLISNETGVGTRTES